MRTTTSSIQVAEGARYLRNASRFLRFASSSLMCTAVDQLIAWSLFASLRYAMAGNDFLRILIATVIARLASLSLNFYINNRLVFSTVDGERDVSSRKTFARFFAVALVVLALSTLGVWWSHMVLGAPEWQAKIVVDLCLFVVNYNMQRTWVFKDGPTSRFVGA